MSEKESKFVPEEPKEGDAKIRLQEIIDTAEERTWEQIEIYDKVYQPRDGDMVELPDGSVGGIITALADRKGRYTVVLEDGTEVKAPASKLLLRGCWTAHIQYKKERERSDGER